MFDLTGKTALVTGATGGIGAGIARAFHKAGAEVAISGRQADKLEALKAELGSRVHVIPCDLADKAAVGKLIDEATAKLGGRLDILVNNAATNPYFGHILDTDPGAFQKTVDVNIRGYFFMSVEGAKLMRDPATNPQRRGGAIVNVASVNGVIPGPMQGIYSITKAAVISMTEAFARECAGLNIRVNALLPGMTDTKFAAALVKNDAIRTTALQHVPLNRVAQPEEMAGAVLYLVSDAASYTTGTSINVDGGYLVS